MRPIKLTNAQNDRVLKLMAIRSTPEDADTIIERNQPLLQAAERGEDYDGRIGCPHCRPSKLVGVYGCEGCLWSKVIEEVKGRQYVRNNGMFTDNDTPCCNVRFNKVALPDAEGVSYYRESEILDGDEVTAAGIRCIRGHMDWAGDMDWASDPA